MNGVFYFLCVWQNAGIHVETWAPVRHLLWWRWKIGIEARLGSKRILVSTKYLLKVLIILRLLTVLFLYFMRVLGCHYFSCKCLLLHIKYVLIISIFELRMRIPKNLQHVFLLRSRSCSWPTSAIIHINKVSGKNWLSVRNLLF